VCAGFSTTSEQNAPLNVLEHSVDGRWLLLCTVPAQCHDEAAHVSGGSQKGFPAFSRTSNATTGAPRRGFACRSTAPSWLERRTSAGQRPRCLPWRTPPQVFVVLLWHCPLSVLCARQGQPRAACTRALLGSRSGAARSAPARPCVDLGYRRRPGWLRV
jgi:hypothetical protein